MTTSISFGKHSFLMKRGRKEGIPIARNALSYSITLATIQKGPSDEQIDNDIAGDIYVFFILFLYLLLYYYLIVYDIYTLGQSIHIVGVHTYAIDAVDASACSLMVLLHHVDASCITMGTIDRAHV